MRLGCCYAVFGSLVLLVTRGWLVLCLAAHGIDFVKINIPSLRVQHMQVAFVRRLGGAQDLQATTAVQSRANRLF